MKRVVINTLATEIIEEPKAQPDIDLAADTEGPLVPNLTSDIKTPYRRLGWNA